MPKESLSDEYLYRVADIIDSECLNCHHAPTSSQGVGNRKIIFELLTEVGQKYDDLGFQGTRFTQSLTKACNYCLAQNRIDFRLYSLTCGLKVRIPERLPPSA